MSTLAWLTWLTEGPMLLGLLGMITSIMSHQYFTSGEF